MHYKGLFFENEEQFDKAKKFLEDSNLIFTEDSTYNQLFVQEAIEQLDNRVKEFTDKDVDELAYCIRDAGDSVIDSDVVYEIAGEWIMDKGYDEA